MKDNILNNKDICNKIIINYQNGLTMAQITNLYNINSYNIKKVLDFYNIPTRSHGGKNKLPEQQIINEYKNGISSTILAKKYNITFSAIIYILKKYNISRNNKYNNINLIRDYWNNIDTFDKAYFLGFLITDGNVYKNNIRLTLKNDISEQKILNTFKKYTKNENTLSIVNRIKNNKPFSEISFQVKCLEWINALANYLVIPNKTNIVELPQLNKDLMPHLLRGLIDGDGCISYKSGYINFCGNQKLVTQVRDYFVHELNVKNNKVIQINTTLYSISWANKKDIITIGNYLYANKYDCYLERKYNNFNILVNGNTEENSISKNIESPQSVEVETEKNIILPRVSAPNL